METIFCLGVWRGGEDFQDIFGNLNVGGNVHSGILQVFQDFQEFSNVDHIFLRLALSWECGNDLILYLFKE